MAAASKSRGELIATAVTAALLCVAAHVGLHVAASIMFRTGSAVSLAEASAGPWLAALAIPELILIGGVVFALLSPDRREPARRWTAAISFAAVVALGIWSLPNSDRREQLTWLFETLFG